MKTSILLCSLALVSPVVAQTSPPTTVPSQATFDWKLRLTKGQTWTQTFTSNIQTSSNAADSRTRKPTRMESNITQTVAVKNVVLDVTPAFYLIRSTYSGFDQKFEIKMNGQTQPVPKTPDVSRALVGASFTIKQASDGRILDVMGLEDLVARQKRGLDSLTKTPGERAAFEQFLPSAQALKQAITTSQSASLPKTPLAIGQSFSYNSSLPASFFGGVTITGQRTLRGFDTQSATLDENGTFNIKPAKPIVTGTGRAYIALKGTTSGQSFVDAQTGLPRKSTTITKITGKTTVIQTGGAPVAVVPLNMTAQTTITTTTP